MKKFLIFFVLCLPYAVYTAEAPTLLVQICPYCNKLNKDFEDFLSNHECQKIHHATPVVTYKPRVYTLETSNSTIKKPKSKKYGAAIILKITKAGERVQKIISQRVSARDFLTCDEPGCAFKHKNKSMLLGHLLTHTKEQ